MFRRGGVTWLLDHAGFVEDLLDALILLLIVELDLVSSPRM